MNLSQLYLAEAKAGKIQPDPHQLKVLEQLQPIADSLPVKRQGLFKKPAAPKGLYLWGGVGVGKSFLVDLLFHHIPLKKKHRLHFHAFMQWVHDKLTELEGHQNPLEKIAKLWAKECQLLCLDELLVNDIGDAMLCAELFKALYHENVCIIFTSNFAPDELYKNGLARSRFLPAIDLIKKHSTVMELRGKHDYRTLAHQHKRHYFTPDDLASEKFMKDRFDEFATNETIYYGPINIFGREVAMEARAGSAIWFQFLAICSVPRSKKDYLFLAKNFEVFFLSNVPLIEPHQDNLILAFMHLVDVLYDEKKQLIISAAAPPERLYTEGRYLFQYQRTQSRLIEMGF